MAPGASAGPLQGGDPDCRCRAQPPAAQRQAPKPCGRPGSGVSGTLTRGSPFFSGGSQGCTSSARGRDQREGALPRAAEALEALCVWSQIPHCLSPPPSRSLSPGPKSQWRLQQLAREEGAAGGGGRGGGCRQRHPLPRHRCRFPPALPSCATYRPPECIAASARAVPRQILIFRGQ